jgi:hypothetical protein
LLWRRSWSSVLRSWTASEVVTSISKSFLLFVAPRRSLTDRRGTPIAEATALSAASVARPDCAGSATRTTSAPS